MARDEQFKQEVLRLAGAGGIDLHSVRHLLRQLPHGASYEPQHQKVDQALPGGQKGGGLHNETLWLCTSCLLCTVRCPRGIRPKAVVSALKDIAEREGQRSKDALMSSSS